MKDFVITCSSTCDMNTYFLRKHNMYYVSFYYYLDGKKYYDDFFKEHSVSEYYERIKTEDVKTSQPDPEQYRDLWNKLIDQGYDILHIELDSGISGAMNSALIGWRPSAAGARRRCAPAPGCGSERSRTPGRTLTRGGGQSRTCGSCWAAWTAPAGRRPSACAGNPAAGAG